jgi:hypothetical protein
MDMQLLKKRLLELRQSWVDLGDGKAVRIQRPSEAELGAYSKSTPVDDARDRVVDWRGFTEADLLGAAVGSADPVPFDRDVWAEVVSDRLTWVKVVSEAVSSAVNAHNLSIGEAEKN